MLTEDKTVLCAKCGTEHHTHPQEREGFDREGLPIRGVFATDYTYHRDWYHDEVAVLCNTHTRDSISQHSTEELYSGS